MTPEEHLRSLLKELTDIWALKVITGDPVSREQEVLAEVDEMRVVYGDELIRRVCSPSSGDESTSG